MGSTCLAAVLSGGKETHRLHATTMPKTLEKASKVRTA